MKEGYWTVYLRLAVSLVETVDGWRRELGDMSRTALIAMALRHIDLAMLKTWQREDLERSLDE